MPLANATTQAIALAPSAARTSTFTSDTITNVCSSDILVYLRVSAGPGSLTGVDTLQLDLQGYDPASGIWHTVNMAGGTGPVLIDCATTPLTHTQKVWWGRPTSQSNTGGATQQFYYTSVQALLYPQMRVRVTHGGTAGTGSWTYSIGAILSAS